MSLRSATLAAAALAFAAATPALAAAPPFTGPEGVSVTKTGAGLIVVSPKGMTLYTYEMDALAGEGSACDGDCANAWPPLIAPADAKPVGDWKTVTRDDGSLQWAHLGKPVYTFAGDAKPGDATGDGAQRVWHAVKIEAPPPELARPPGLQLVKAGQAYLLADHRGRTLYRPGDPAEPCAGACAEDYPLLRAPALAQDVGEWKAVAGSDSVRGWTFRGAPLHVFVGDTKPGERGGEGGGWSAVVIEADEGS